MSHCPHSHRALIEIDYYGERLTLRGSWHTQTTRRVWPIQDAAYEINDALSAIAQEVPS